MATNPQQTGFASGRTTTVALVQMRCSCDRAANLAVALDRIAEAAAAGANIVCLPELFSSPYPCQDEDFERFGWAEPIPGPISNALAEASKRSGVAVVGTVFERRAAGVYHNTAVVFDADGRLAGLYRKMHIPDDPHFYEKFYFAPGDLGFRCFDTRFGRVGVCICWDQWFPEAARLTALAGAELIFCPTAIGWLPEHDAANRAGQHSAWETSMRAHAIANGLFVAAVNRTGTEGALEFWGASFACDPLGGVMVRGEHDAEQVLLAKCDLADIERVRTHWPFFRDRRIDAYGDMKRRFCEGKDY